MREHVGVVGIEFKRTGEGGIGAIVLALIEVDGPHHPMAPAIRSIDRQRFLGRREGRLKGLDRFFGPAHEDIGEVAPRQQRARP